MSTTTTNYGLIKPDTTDPILIGQLNDNADIIDATLKSLSDVLDVAKLGIKYKGEVNYYSNLPASGNEIGDAYTVKYAGSSGTTPDGTEYVWGTVSGTNQWINFSKDSYSKAEVDALLSLKANIADIPTPSTAAPAMDGTAAAGTSTNYARADHVHPSDTSKQDALTAAQLAAVNSGINSTKVEQIETNKSNISTDEAALIELVDGGAKNLFQISANAYQSDINGLTATFNADGSVTVTGTMADTTKNAIIYISPNRNMDYRKYQGCVLSGGISENERITLQNSVSPYNSIAISKGTGVEITNIIPEKTLLFIHIAKRSTAVNYTFKPMICTKAAWDISHEYQPYRPSYQELYERVVALEQANQ